MRPSKHKLCRPPKGAIEVERLLANGKWKKDDGKPGLAFSGKQCLSPSDAYFPIAWWVKCDEDSCRIAYNCSGRLAMDHTADRYKCANGHYVEEIKIKDIIMPSCVRNFWLKLSIDGREKIIEAGPKNGGGGFSLTILMRECGAISSSALYVTGRVNKDGRLILKAYDYPEGREIEIVTNR